MREQSTHGQRWLRDDPCRATSCARPHTQDFFFCKSLTGGEERMCTSSWTMRDGLEALVRITRARDYPTVETCMPYSPVRGRAPEVLRGLVVAAISRSSCRQAGCAAAHQPNVMQ